MANCYQCYGCGCTLYADALSENECTYNYITNGELCSSCQQEEDDEDDYYYDD